MSGTLTVWRAAAAAVASVTASFAFSAAEASREKASITRMLPRISPTTIENALRLRQQFACRVAAVGPAFELAKSE